MVFYNGVFRKRIITEQNTNGLKANFGNEGVFIKLIEKITLRKGIGEILADGVKQASARIGNRFKKFAMHVKGLELPGYDVRASQGMELASI